MALFRVANERAQFDAAGLETSDVYGAGIRFTQGGNARVTTSAGTFFNQGIPMSGTGQVAIVDATAGLPSGTIFHNGLPMSGDKVCVSKNATAVVSNGLPFDSAGALAADINFDLNFVNATSLNSSVTFTRASTATYFNSAGVLTSAAINEARFDYDPATLAAQGLLIEEQRTNLRTYSDEITVANSYSVVNTTLSTVSTSTPISGVTTATLSVLNVGANTGNTQDGLNYRSTVVSNTTQYTQSIFVKPAGATVLRLRNNSLGGTADFILTGNGTAPGLVSGIQAATIAPVGDGWYRCTWTFTTGSTAPGNRMDYWSLKSDVADGVNGLYFTGAQFEAGAFPTSYIPTTTTALTRSADVASVNTLSPWWNASEGTFYVEGSASNFANSPIFVMPHDGTSNNYLNTPLITTTGLARLAGVVGGAAWTNVNTANSTTINTTFKSASAFKAADQAVCLNAGTVATGTNASLPVVTTLQLGTWRTGAANSINGYLRRVVYYPRRLSNAELQSITS